MLWEFCAAHEWILQGQERAILGYCYSALGPESDPRDFGDSIDPFKAAAGPTKNIDACVGGLGVWAWPVGALRHIEPELKEQFQALLFHIS